LPPEAKTPRGDAVAASELAMRLERAGYRNQNLKKAMLASRVPARVVNMALRIGVRAKGRGGPVAVPIEELLGRAKPEDVRGWARQGLTMEEVMLCLRGLGVEAPVRRVSKIFYATEVSPEAMAIRKKSVSKASSMRVQSAKAASRAAMEEETRDPAVEEERESALRKLPAGIRMVRGRKF
jgi:hypothetical protein